MDNTNELKWIACMFHLPPGLSDWLSVLLNEYDVGQYLIAHETERYSHYHIVAQMTEKDYHKFSKRIVDKYKLRGRARPGQPRQYGKLRTINDLERLLIYTCKDKNVVGNFSEEEIAKYIERSFKKDDKKNFFIELQKFIDSTEQPSKEFQEVFGDSVRFRTCDGLVYNADWIKGKIIEFYRDKEIVLGQSQLEAQFFAYTQHKNSKWRMTIKEQMDYYKYRYK